MIWYNVLCSFLAVSSVQLSPLAKKFVIQKSPASVGYATLTVIMKGTKPITLSLSLSLCLSSNSMRLTRPCEEKGPQGQRSNDS